MDIIERIYSLVKPSVNDTDDEIVKQINESIAKRYPVSKNTDESVFAWRPSARRYADIDANIIAEDVVSRTKRDVPMLQYTLMNRPSGNYTTNNRDVFGFDNRSKRGQEFDRSVYVHKAPVYRKA